MKKLIFTLSLIIVFLLFVIGGIFLVSFFLSETRSDEEKTDFYWIPEKSYFVDYKIEKNKIVFSYSICFINNSESDVSVAVSAKFKKSEINKWIKYQSFFMGCDKEGNIKYNIIKAGEQKNVVFYFEGEYISRNINTELSFPDELIITTR